jgi:hypothetical protein
MPKYGDKEYWDERYMEDAKPFDWLFDYRELSPLIELLLPNKDEQLFPIGCGNAPFSPHMTSKGKYTNVWNTEVSPTAERSAVPTTVSPTRLTAEPSAIFARKSGWLQTVTILFLLVSTNKLYLI